MYPLSDLRLLILEENNLVDLTVNSLHKNMPNVPYKVVSCEPGARFPTTFSSTKGITLVLRSGVVVDKEIEMPDKVINYHLCVSRRAVHITNERLKLHYPLIAPKLTEAVLDLSVFLVNIDMWDTPPESDRGVLRDKKLLYMPRRMNHKEDVLFGEEAVATIDGLQYGIDGESAIIHNYIDCIEKDNISVLETYAYNFDKLLPYTDGLSPKYKKRVEYLGNLSKIRISKMRKALSDIKYI